MTEWILALVPQYGLWLLLGCTFLSCLALPFPASILMMTAGGFAAAGDLSLWKAFLVAASGGILGDQLGYWAARIMGAPLLARASRDPSRAKMLQKAKVMLAARGTMAVFLTRWLFSPLGPWVNLLTGTARFDALRFGAASVVGESLWASIYIGAGFGFAGNLAAASDMLGSILGFIMAAAAALFLGLWLRAAFRAQNEHG